MYLFKLQWTDIPNMPGPRTHHRDLHLLDTAVFHRIGVGKDGKEIADFFAREGKKWIGTTDMPYTFIIPEVQPAGDLIVVEQCVPLDRITPHAKNWNSRGIGIGVVGDFRRRAPSKKQTAACCWLAQRLRDKYEAIRRPKSRDFLATLHSSLTTGTFDKSKLTGGLNECPGRRFGPTYREIRLSLETGGVIK